MRYRNTVTGAVIDSPCVITGGDLEPVKPEPKGEPAKEPAGKAKKA